MDDSLPCYSCWTSQHLNYGAGVHRLGSNKYDATNPFTAATPDTTPLTGITTMNARYIILQICCCKTQNDHMNVSRLSYDWLSCREFRIYYVIMRLFI